MYSFNDSVKIYETKTCRTQGKERQIHSDSWQFQHTSLLVDRRMKIGKDIQDLYNAFNENDLLLLLSRFSCVRLCATP